MKGLMPEMTLLCERTMYARKTNILKPKFDTIVNLGCTGWGHRIYARTYKYLATLFHFISFTVGKTS